MFKKYLEYLKDNPNHYWFKRKLYGWGWTPVTWQGWLLIALFAFMIAFNIVRIDMASHSVSDTLVNAVPGTIFFILILIYICYKKGESPKWMWGGDKKRDDSTKNLSCSQEK